MGRIGGTLRLEVEGAVQEKGNNDHSLGGWSSSNRNLRNRKRGEDALSGG